MTQIINPSLISDSNTFKFKPFKSESVDQIDVYYKNQRVAIINGISSPLQWTAKNESNIPVSVVEQLESLVVKLIKKSNK